MKIIVEIPLLPELVEAYALSDGFDLERAANDTDAPQRNNHNPVTAINDLLNEYLTLYETSEESDISTDEEDQVMVLIDDIISTIVELIPSVTRLEMLSLESSSLNIFCGDCE